MKESAWLIECGSPALYYCGEGDWCSNPNHAKRFGTKEEAEILSKNWVTMEPIRVCEHAWV